MTDSEVTYSVLFPFCGLGGGAYGFLNSRAELLGRKAQFVSLGGIDFDPDACKDFVYLTKSPALCVDIAKLTVDRLREFVGTKAPDVVFLSAPCKGSSKLVSDAKADEPKYREMNRLAEVWIDLMLSAWDVPPKLVLFENVPNLTTRASAMLKRVKAALRKHGYLLHDGYHECGELGGLAQRRRRWLMVARHASRVPALLFQPPKKRVRACGEVLGPLPMPNDPAGGPMHVMPKISWLNWVRLSLIPAGGDWRDLDGVLKEGQERRAVFKRHEVLDWNDASGVITGSGSNAVSNIADPRITLKDNPGRHHNKYAVSAWDEPAKTVTGATRPGSGSPNVADPRQPDWFRNILGVVPWTEPLGTVTGGAAPSRGAFTVADPRVKKAFDHGYGVLKWTESSPTVAGGSHPGQGAYSVADARLGCAPRAGAYGVIPYDEAAKTITGSACIDNGAFAIADPRFPESPVMIIRDVRKAPPLVPVILAKDGTWHRPLTTLELAVLQGLPWMHDGAPLSLAGTSSSKHRERIGNAVPAPTAEAIGTRMLVNLLASEAGSFFLSSEGAVWVRPVLETRRLDGAEVSQ